MITVIEHGNMIKTLQRKKCIFCKCIFEFENSDIFFSHYGYEFKEIYKVNCPECHRGLQVDKIEEKGE